MKPMSHTITHPRVPKFLALLCSLASSTAALASGATPPALVVSVKDRTDKGTEESRYTVPLPTTNHRSMITATDPSLGRGASCRADTSVEAALQDGADPGARTTLRLAVRREIVCQGPSGRGRPIQGEPAFSVEAVLPLAQLKDSPATIGSHTDRTGRVFTVAVSAALGPAVASLAQRIEGGVRKLAADEREIDRDVMEAILGDLGDLVRSMRVTPELKGGRPVGLRLSSLRADSALARLGFEDGDVVSSINGIDLSTPDRALEAYTTLRAASHVTVSLERGGRKMSLEYAIR